MARLINVEKYQRAQFFRRYIDLWSNVPHAVNVGKAAELLDAYAELDPSDPEYDADEKEVAEDIVARR